MSEIVGWIALGISSILAIIEIIKLVKYWKRPNVEVEISIPNSKLEIKDGVKWVELIHIQIHLINSGNEDVLIRSLKIEHIEFTTQLKSWKFVDRDFNLPTRKSKDYVINDTISYNPKENKKMGGEWDNISVIAEYGKNKKSWEKFYFVIDEKTGKIWAFTSESSLKKL